MLENFTDQEIATDLLDTGYLYQELPDGKQRRVKTVAAAPMASIKRRDYSFEEDGVWPSHQYLSLKVLLINEGIAFDDIRKSWKYHGVLLSSAKFCEKLMHDQGCPCSLCVPAHKSFIDWCRYVVATPGFVIADTETTGLHESEIDIVDLAILSIDGKELYNQLLKPKVPITSDAMRTHRITEEVAALAPLLEGEWSRICDIVGNRTIITWNTKFDQARIEQAMRLHGLNACSDCQWRYDCAMVRYANWYGEPSLKGYKNAQWQSLSSACYQQGIALPPGLHRAMPDCQATLALIAKIAATGENSKRYGG